MTVVGMMDSSRPDARAKRGIVMNAMDTGTKSRYDDHVESAQQAESP